MLIAKPLFSLTEVARKLVWDNLCQEAFESLKQKLVTLLILSLPAETGEFVLDTNASNHGLDAVLLQIQDGKEKVLAYYSRVFSKLEWNYCVTRRGLLLWSR